LWVKEVLAEVHDEHVKGVLLITELVFVHRDPVLDGGVRERGKHSRDLVLRIRSVLGKEVLCVFLPFDEDRQSDFAWSQCGRDFVRGVRCDDCDFKERGIRDASHKTWCVVNVVYAFVAVHGSAWKLAYEYETRVYACKMQVYVCMRVKRGCMPVKAGVYVQVRWYASETRVTKAEGAVWARVS